MDPPADPEREPMPRHLKPMLATLSTLPRDDERLGVRDQVGRGPRDRLLRGRTPAAREPHPPRDHLALPRAARPGRGARLPRGGPRRRGGRLRRGGPAELRAAPGPHEPRLRGGGAPPDGRSPGHLPDLRPPLPRRSLPASTLPYTERRERLEELELDGPHWQTPSHHRGEGEALLRLTEDAGPRGPGRQAARQPLPARAAQLAPG